MADDGRSDSILIPRTFADEDCATTAQGATRTTTLPSGSSTVASTISCTNTVTSTTDEVNDEKRSTKAQHEVSIPSTPRMASSLTPDVVPQQNQSSVLSLKDIANLVRHAPPPLSMPPVSTSHPLPNQSSRRSSMSAAEGKQNRSRKNSSAHAHQRKGSTNTQRSRSVSMSINNGHIGRHRPGRTRNSMGRKREAHFTNSYQNIPPVTSMHVSRFPTDTTRSVVPTPSKCHFQGTKSDLSHHRTQRICSEASFENVYPVDYRAYGRSADFDRDTNQQLNKEVHDKRRTQSGTTDWRGRNRSYGTSADDEFLMSNKNGNPFMFNPKEKNATLSNGSCPDVKHDSRCTRNLPSFSDSLTEGLQQLRLGNDFSQDTIRRLTASSKLQTSHSGIETTTNVSRSLHDPFLEDVSYACQGDTRRRNCNTNALCSASEREGNFLTRKQVGYGRQDAILPTSPSNSRFADLSYLHQNSYDRRQDSRQIDLNEHRKEKVLNMNLHEHRNNSRHVQMDTNNERLYNDSNIVSHEQGNNSRHVQMNTNNERLYNDSNIVSHEHRNNSRHVQMNTNNERLYNGSNIVSHEQGNNSRHVQIDTNNERLYNDGNITSTNGFRNNSSRSYNRPFEDSNYRSNNGRRYESDYGRESPQALRQENPSPGRESISSQSTCYSNSGDSGAFLGLPKPCHKSPSPLPDAERNVPRSADARGQNARGKRSDGKNGTKNEHKQSANFKADKNLSSICQADEESARLNSEIEEEMIRARNMDIPVKFDSTKQSNEPKLNPSAQTFAPLCYDANGNIFRISSNKGVSFFHKLSRTDGSNPNYLIPPHDNETGTVSSGNAENIHHGNRVPAQQSLSNVANSQWDMPAVYPQVSSSNHVNATTYFNAMVQAPSMENGNPAVQMHANINRDIAASPDLTYSSFGHMNTLPINLVGTEQTLISGFNETSVNFTNNSAYASNFTNDMAHLNYPNFPQMNGSVADGNTPFPQNSNQNYDASPDLNSPNHIPVNPFEVPQPLSNQQFAFQNPSGQPFPILINETSPYLIQSSVSPFMQTSEYNTQLYNVNPSSVTTPVILAMTPMTPSPLGPFPDNVPLAGMPNANQQMISQAPFQTQTENSSVLPEQSQPGASQPPIMNLQTYVALMDNNPADANTAMPNFFPMNSSSFPEEKPTKIESKPDNSKNHDRLTKYDCQSSDEHKNIEMTLIREVIEKFVETVRRTDKESPVPLTKRQFADVLCGKSPSMINDIMASHSRVNAERDENNPNLKEKTSEKDDFQESQPEVANEHSDNLTTSSSVESETDHLEIPCPSSVEKERASNSEKNDFPFGFETETDSPIENSSITPSGNRIDSYGGESGFVSPTTASDTEFRESTELVNPELQISQDDERRDSIGNVSVEKRIDYFEKHKSL